MELKPAGQQEWIRLVRRVLFDERDSMLVALTMASYADPDGTRVYPGTKRLMNVTQRSRATIGRCLMELRGKGLIELLAEASQRGRKGGTDEYRLTYPDDILDRLEMLDPDEGVTRSYPQPGLTSETRLRVTG